MVSPTIPICILKTSVALAKGSSQIDPVGVVVSIVCPKKRDKEKKKSGKKENNFGIVIFSNKIAHRNQEENADNNF